MPNYRAHALTGMSTAFVANLGMQYACLPVLPDGSRDLSKLDFVEAFLAIGVGLVGASLPDLLEPASSPNHRKFFHSSLLAGGTTGGVVKYCMAGKTENLNVKDIISDPGSRLLLAGQAAYYSHILLDARTPKGVPLLGLKLC